MTKEELKDMEEIIENANAIILCTIKDKIKINETKAIANSCIKVKGNNNDILLLFYSIVSSLIENGIPLDDLQWYFNKALTNNNCFWKSGINEKV